MRVACAQRCRVAVRTGASGVPGPQAGCRYLSTLASPRYAQLYVPEVTFLIARGPPPTHLSCGPRRSSLVRCGPHRMAHGLCGPFDNRALRAAARPGVRTYSLHSCKSLASRSRFGSCAYIGITYSLYSQKSLYFCKIHVFKKPANTPIS